MFICAQNDTYVFAMKPKLILCLAFVLIGGLIACRADSNTPTDVTNILRNLLTNKTLVLSTRSKFIIETSPIQARQDGRILPM